MVKSLPVVVAESTSLFLKASVKTEEKKCVTQTRDSFRTVNRKFYVGLRLIYREEVQNRK